MRAGPYQSLAAFAFPTSRQVTRARSKLDLKKSDVIL